VDVFEADVGAGEGEHGFVDVGAAGVSAGEVAVGVQPGDRSLDHPAVASETGPVAGVAFGDVGCDPAFSQFAAVVLGIVGPVGVNAAWTELAVTACRWHAIHELEELRDVVAVGARQCDRERDAFPVDDYVVLAARTRAIDRRGAGLLAPPLARTCELSTTARDQSISPASCNSSSRTWCKRCQTPASFHSCKRRQQVMPDPQPISWGKCSHGMPVFSTNRIPVNAARSGTLGRPVTCGARTGKTGSIRAHNSSLNSSLAMTQDFDSPTTNPTFC
jgi:hypothetical protein